MTTEQKPAQAPGHKWDIDLRGGGTKKCVRCGETWWNGPMRPCVKQAKQEARR
jgi:hypothetical protein